MKRWIDRSNIINPFHSTYLHFLAVLAVLAVLAIESIHHLVQLRSGKKIKSNREQWRHPAEKRILHAVLFDELCYWQTLQTLHQSVSVVPVRLDLKFEAVIMLSFWSFAKFCAVITFQKF